VFHRSLQKLERSPAITAFRGENLEHLAWRTSGRTDFTSTARRIASGVLLK
jgi:hypothetical protein